MWHSAHQDDETFEAHLHYWRSDAGPPPQLGWLFAPTERISRCRSSVRRIQMCQVTVQRGHVLGQSAAKSFSGACHQSIHRLLLDCKSGSAQGGLGWKICWNANQGTNALQNWPPTWPHFIRVRSVCPMGISYILNSGLVTWFPNQPRITYGKSLWPSGGDSERQPLIFGWGQHSNLSRAHF
jgi:hypothetical protein